MVSQIKVDVINKETIEPSSPTPHHLRRSSLSVFDQFQPEIFIPLLLFYSNNKSDHHSSFAERSNLLKTSLSEALTHFYPYAGKFEYNDSICCNDQGAAFLEAQVNCLMSEILDKPDFGVLEQLLPTDMKSTLSDTGYLLLVQANFFECGGLVIGVSISHKVADVSTLNTFIKIWAEIAFGVASTTDHVLFPAKFGAAASLFPPLDFFNSPEFSLILPLENCITRRFVFDASNIAALKSTGASTAVPNPTRVEIVSALIWKCIVQASRTQLDFIKPSVWCPIVNMRKRSAPALAENILGNFVWYFAAMTVESEVQLVSLVAKLRNGIEEYKEKYPKGVSGEDIFQTLKESGNLMERDDLESYTCSSWCRLSFYEANFGWGKPLWVSSRSIVKNTILLMDMRDGDGIEASLTLREEDMAIIESSEDMLTYASPNPAVPFN